MRFPHVGSRLAFIPPDLIESGTVTTTSRTPDSTHFAHELGLVFGRSLFPFVALGLLLGTFLWGPWVTLLLAVVWWKLVTVVG